MSTRTIDGLRGYLKEKINDELCRLGLKYRVKLFVDSNLGVRFEDALTEISLTLKEALSLLDDLSEKKALTLAGFWDLAKKSRLTLAQRLFA